jgi:hypothetical protein
MRDECEQRQAVHGRVIDRASTNLIIDASNRDHSCLLMNFGLVTRNRGEWSKAGGVGAGLCYVKCSGSGVL